MATWRRRGGGGVQSDPFLIHPPCSGAVAFPSHLHKTSSSGTHSLNNVVFTSGLMFPPQHPCLVRPPSQPLGVLYPPFSQFLSHNFTFVRKGLVPVSSSLDHQFHKAGTMLSLSRHWIPRTSHGDAVIFC